MLIQLSSETGLLVKPFRFVPGINIILGKYSEGKEKKGINGIGKSSLIRLIDFTLLSNSAEKRFSQEKYDFLRNEGHNVVLEFKVGTQTYFIKRTFDPDNGVLFGEQLEGLVEYTKAELKSILTNKFFPVKEEDVFFVGERYGTLMDFFIKDDLENQRRVDPINFSAGTSRQTSKAIFNFFLIGLPTRGAIKFEELSSEYSRFAGTAKGLIDKIKIDYGKSIEEFKSEKIKIEQNIALLEGSLRDYKFLDNYKGVESKIIDLSSQITGKLKDYHSLNRKLKKIKEAFQFNQEIDTEQIKKLYNETLSTFGDIVSRTLDEITTFKKEILENRNKFLISRESQLQKSIDEVLSDISKLEQKRSEHYKKLEEKGALESIENAYEQLTEAKAQLAGNLQILNQIEELQNMMSNLHVTISEVKRDILNELKQNEHILARLRALFLEILKNAILLEEDEMSGYFDISINANSSRNSLPFTIEVEIPKADALGQSRLKLVAYDLMVFLNNIENKRVSPDFLIHDGVYHGISLNTKIKAMNYIYHLQLAHPDFQYFVTFNEDEIYVPDERREVVGQFDFDLETVVIAEFTDAPNGMIFKRDFK